MVDRLASTSMSDESDLPRRVEELTDELERLRLVLEVVGTVDVETGMLNRTGILDALERGQRWLVRRGDIYGLIVVRFPRLADEVLQGEDAVEFRIHVAATIGAAVRDVDSVGRIDDRTFAAVLADLNPGAIDIVAGRLQALLERLTASTAAIGGEFRVGAIEILSQNPSGTVLDTTLRLATEADPNRTSLGQL
jgi:GGDEF domain-containing protein